MMKPLKITCMLVAFLSCGASSAFCQWGLQTLEQLTRSAPVIVIGTVLDVRTEYGEYLGRDDFIFTFSDIAIQHALKGKKTNPDKSTWRKNGKSDYYR